MQCDDRFARLGPKTLVGIEACLGFDIEGLEIADDQGIGVVEHLRSGRPQVGDEHTELGAPIPHMILAVNGVALEL